MNDDGRREPADPAVLQQRCEELQAQVDDLTAQKCRRDAFDAAALRAAHSAFSSLFVGDKLYRASFVMWDRWSSWLKEPSSQWPEVATRNFVVELVSRLTRIVTYGFIVAAVPALVLLVQTYILYVQTGLIETNNTMIEHQTNLQAFEQTSRFRDMLYRKPLDENNTEMDGYVDSADVSVWPQANKSIIDQLAHLAVRETDGVGALTILLRDESGSVSAGALLTLIRHRELMRRNGQLIEADKARLVKAVFPPHTDFGKVSLDDAELIYAKLPWSKAGHIRMNRVQAAGIDLSYADLDGLMAADADLSGAILVGAHGTAILRGSDLRGVRLGGASLENSDLSGATFRPEMITGFDGDGIKLTNAKIEGMLTSASLNKVSFEGVVSNGLMLSYLSLKESRFGHATLVMSKWIANDFTQADFTKADLRGSSFDELLDDRGEQYLRSHAGGANFNLARLEFADLRGVEGLKSEMLKQACLGSTTLPAYLVMEGQYTKPSECPSDDLRIATGYFAFNTSDLADETMENLDAAAKFIQSRVAAGQIGFEVVVSGHTVEASNDSMDMAFSERRANAVKIYLIRKGVDARRIRTVAYGRSRMLVGGNEDPADRFMNNRFEVDLIAEPTSYYTYAKQDTAEAE